MIMAMTGGHYIEEYIEQSEGGASGTLLIAEVEKQFSKRGPPAGLYKKLL